MSGTVTSSRRVRSIRRFFAVAFGEYPRRWTAAITLRRVAGATTAAFDSTRDTVAVDTPAVLATSLIFATGQMIPNSQRPTPNRPVALDVEVGAWKLQRWACGGA